MEYNDLEMRYNNDEIEFDDAELSNKSVILLWDMLKVRHSFFMIYVHPLLLLPTISLPLQYFCYLYICFHLKVVQSQNNFSNIPHIFIQQMEHFLLISF